MDTQSQKFEEVTKTIRRKRDKGSKAGNDNFCPKLPLERSSNLSTFLSTKKSGNFLQFFVLVVFYEGRQNLEKSLHFSSVSVSYSPSDWSMKMRL